MTLMSTCFWNLFKQFKKSLWNCYQTKSKIQMWQKAFKKQFFSKFDDFFHTKKWVYYDRIFLFFFFFFLHFGQIFIQEKKHWSYWSLPYTTMFSNTSHQFWSKVEPFRFAHVITNPCQSPRPWLFRPLHNLIVRFP